MECNPFHEGHRYIIGKAGEIAGDGGHIVVVMSGAFTQRGIPAVRSKEIRARQVLEAGADLILELPVRYATADAGHFAEGAVALLAGTGIVTDMVFGSECADIHALERCARFLAKEPGDYRRLLRRYLAAGLSYPAARARAASECGAAIRLPDSPNDVLGVEYLRILQGLPEDGGPAGGMTPHAIPRISAASASSLREHLAAADDGSFPDDFSGMLLGKLLMIERGGSRYTLEDYAGVSADLARRIHHLLPQFVSWTQFCGLLKTRNLTHTAVSRALTHILLDITADMLPSNADAARGVHGLIPCCRVLGARRTALPLLGSIRDNGLVTITSKADADRSLPDGSPGRALLNSDLHASEAWELSARMKSAARMRSQAAPDPDAGIPAVPEFSKPLIIV